MSEIGDNTWAIVEEGDTAYWRGIVLDVGPPMPEVSDGE